MYDIAKNKWSDGPQMQATRVMHCVCLLGDSIYAFGGIKNANFQLQEGIEKLNVEQLMAGRPATW